MTKRSVMGQICVLGDRVIIPRHSEAFLDPKGNKLQYYTRALYKGEKSSSDTTII